MKINWKLVWSFYVTFAIPLLYLTNIYLAYSFPKTINGSIFTTIAGTIIAVTGLCIWLTSYLHLGKSFGVLPQKQKRVVSGIYKYINHPMYLGIWLTLLGLSLANSSRVGIIFLCLIITPLFALRIKLEEKKLID
ncbi:MAG: hypothetical protein CO135_00875 [Candidatus Levybacteria bacterium CG_4_9_14_3_um_filter_35_16]|nr:MAG: hypothetical protein COW87_00535 [Candidatus Levybacteria bacterium CG22_combo_CG10-13_8_21_14_all_35_11]PIY94275.1 MAG: hypothetical protein COY68_03360 [Candidatus Levybacteria bacterium CG_4_10_14_0_8_um_filter_35_23]PJA91511.1 MAG: hypothetical protein CO135_00875 [Candidatus Levybacteria bacterium CG_4_9_14_3_um_filter_35_16]PJC54126.1 MAG: hypothetical protein CO028_03965 [Candidatus Levybacteria bacterium CG_4_9_14_0_2_um_filter_35_21]